MREVKHLFERRDLLFQLTRAEIGLQYRNKALGFVWAVLDPILLMITYYVLVKVIFNRGGENYAALIFAAILSWRWFLQSTLSSVKLFTSNAQLIQTVRFPYSALPMSRNLLHSFNFLTGLLAFIPLFFLFDIRPTAMLLWLPLILLIQFVLNAGVSLLFAYMGVYLRDLHNIMSFLLRLVFYLSPGLYMVADMPQEFQKPMLWINPFAALFESYKNILVFGKAPSPMLVVTLGVGLLMAALALLLLSNQNRLTKDL